MSETTIDPNPSTDAAAALEAERSVDRARMKSIGRTHFLMVMGALTLWGAADAWAAVSDLGLARLVAVANAFIAAYVITGVLHEWGHFAGARLSGAASPVHEKPINHFFMFDFPFDRNDGRQFLWMSWGGIIAPWALVLLTLWLVPIDTAGRAMLLAVFFARAVSVSLFEVPVVMRAMGGGDPRTELGRQLGAGALKSSGNLGIAAGAVVWLVVVLI